MLLFFFREPGASELPEVAEVLGAEPDSPPPPQGSQQEVPFQEPQVHQVFPTGEMMDIKIYGCVRLYLAFLHCSGEQTQELRTSAGGVF